MVKHGVTRNDWVIMDNFKCMYHYNYNGLVKAVIVVQVTEEEYLDVKGNVVNEFDITKLGNNTRFRMVHPSYLLFIEKMGSNTNAEKYKTLN